MTQTIALILAIATVASVITWSAIEFQHRMAPILQTMERKA